MDRASATSGSMDEAAIGSTAGRQAASRDFCARRGSRQTGEADLRAAQDQIAGEIHGNDGARNGRAEAERRQQRHDVVRLHGRGAEQDRVVVGFRIRPDASAPGEIRARDRRGGPRVKTATPSPIRRSLDPRSSARYGQRRQADLPQQRRALRRVEREGYGDAGKPARPNAPP